MESYGNQLGTLTSHIWQGTREQKYDFGIECLGIKYNKEFKIGLSLCTQMPGFSETTAKMVRSE